MHHQDFSGDPPGSGSRKAAYHYRRGSSGASGASNPGDDNTQAAQAGSSSPGLHHHHQHHQSQSQVAAAGAQVKKKSGFQITSVTSAQINVSGNNSLADDTESYDDMDESHTEDLSSSDMLDVSVSRATDTGVPERSSSDETLNSLHGVDTPGLASPNDPLQPQQPASMVNGTVHPHHYYPPQPGQAHHHHSDSLGGGEPALPVASSSPALVSKPGPGPSQRPPDATVGDVNISAGFDNANVSGQVAAAPNTQTQHTQTQAATGSRFRVVKLDTNSEPFRKGRWTCTEYYEKELPPQAAVEAPKGADAAAAETEAGAPAVQPPHTLQPYQQPTQDFTSPQAMQSPPQGLAQTAPLTYVSPQEVHMQKPVVPLTLPAAVPQTAVAQPPSGLPQQLPYVVDPHQAQQPQAAGYAAPQLHAGVMAAGSVRQPDFIQPTAPFQNQVQPPLPHVTTGISITPVPGVTAQQAVGMALQGPGAAPAFAAQLPSSTHTGGTPYMPLPAVLQPLLTPGAAFAQVPAGGSSIKTSQLEDAQKLLLQHQGLLSLPRLGGEDAAAAAVGSLAHMGMSAEASAFMVAAAAGLRTQHAEGEEDSSSGASVVAIDNKIEQAMDLVKSHLMYAVREEVEVLKEQIKELIERNTQLEQENNLLKNLASPEQMAQFQAQVQTGGSPTANANAAVGAIMGQPPVAAPVPAPSGTPQVLPSSQSSGTSA